MCDQQSLRSAAQADQSLCSSLEYLVSVRLLTDHRLEFLSIKVGCTCSSESTLAKLNTYVAAKVIEVEETQAHY